ncbi:MAG: hypothetical protein IJT95_03335 [Abditibacteriota bacterium]|nr:hypothetical protein [Abditibacteriota bacterium]
MPLLFIAAAFLLAGCGGDGSDDSKAKEKMRLLKKTDTVTLKQQDVEEGAVYVYTFNETNIPIADSDDSIRCEVNEAVPFTGGESLGDWNYFKTVQLDDGSVCDIGGNLNEEGVLEAEYINLLCPAELEVGATWTGNGTTYTVTDYQFVCDDDSDAYGAFLVESAGAFNSKVWWSAKEIGFPVKCIYDSVSLKIVKYKDDI